MTHPPSSVDSEDKIKPYGSSWPLVELRLTKSMIFFQSAELNIAISILLQIIMSACTKSQRSNREKTRSNYASYILPRDNYWYIKCPIASHWHYVQPLLLWSVILFVPSVSGRRKQNIWIIQAHYKKKFNSWSVVLFQHTIIYRTHMELFQVHKKLI